MAIFQQGPTNGRMACMWGRYTWRSSTI